MFVLQKKKNLKGGQKLCPNLLIKKIDAQLINGKPGKKPLQRY
jgi:hypothetical protein